MSELNSVVSKRRKSGAGHPAPHFQRQSNCLIERDGKCLFVLLGSIVHSEYKNAHLFLCTLCEIMKCIKLN